MEKFVDDYVDLEHHTRDEAIALFSYIALLFSQGKDGEVLQRFIK